MSANGLNGKLPHGIEAVIAETLAIAKAIEKTSPAELPHKTSLDVDAFDVHRRALPAERREFEKILSRVEAARELETSGQITFEQRVTIEEQALEQLDELTERIARRAPQKGKK